METEYETLGIDETRINAQLEVYRKLGELAQDPDWVEDLINALHTIEIKALDFAVMCKAELPTVQRLYESRPDELGAHTLDMACKHGNNGCAKHLADQDPDLIATESLFHACWSGHFDVITPFARQKPEIVSTPHKESIVEYPIALCMSNGAPESDIQTLVELWPEGSAASMCWEQNILSTPLQQCVPRGYSKELLEFMIQNLPDIIQQFEMADEHTTVTSTDLGWLEKVLNKSRSTFRCTSLEWSGPGYEDFLSLLFLKENRFKELEIGLLPNQLADTNEDNDQVALAMVEFAKKSPPQEANTRIKKLSLEFGHPAYCLLLDALLAWPWLRTLDVNVADHLEPSIPAICGLLQHGYLQDLKIKAKESVMMPKKGNGSSDEIVVPLQPVFDALAVNATVTSLEIGRLEDNEDKVITERLLVEVLKKNATMQNVKLLLKSLPRRPISWKAGPQLSYFLDLNRCGRMIVRHAYLGDFVALLGYVRFTLQMPEPFDLDDHNNNVTSVQYGLLQENVGKWTG